MALFRPFRALGHITDDVPFVVQRRGSETFCVVSVGCSWQVYNTAKLTVVLIGPLLPRRITSLACAGDRTYSALEGGNIVECRRVHVTGVLRAPRTGQVAAMLVLGNKLLAVGWGGLLCVWTIGHEDSPETVIELEPGFVPTTLAHPDTYLNKVVIGSSDGRLQLWNFSTGTKLHEFKSLQSSINVIASSPALDVVGLGLADGRAVLINLRFDEIVAEFSNAAGAGARSERLLRSSSGAAHARAGGAEACTALTFRTGPGLPLLAAGGAGGTMTIWDLERRRLHAVVPEAHDAAVVRAFFFVGEPRLMTAGRDNSLKQWVLDAPSNGGAGGPVSANSTAPPPRLLRFRAGHAAPPAMVRHHGAGGRMLLSAGQDRTFRVFSTIRDSRSHELSQRHVEARAKKVRAEITELRLPRVTAFASCSARDRDWAGAITAHAGEGTAYTWRLQEGALGEHSLTPPPLLKRSERKQERLQRAQDPGTKVLPEVTAVGLSSCGNFGLVGTADGRAHRFNMQSGIHRGEYRRPTATNKKEQQDFATSSSNWDMPAHDGPVSGIVSDSTNRWLATTGQDGFLRIWDFKGRLSLAGELNLGARAERLAIHGASGLVAVTCSDYVIRVVDLVARRIVRRFEGHLDRITDLQFSEDCRWVLSSSMDGTLRVWDVPGAQVLQVLDLGGPITSLSLSPVQDLLATTRADSRGIDIWSNQLFYGEGTEVVPGSSKPVPVERPQLALDEEGHAEGESKPGVREVRIAGSSLANEEESEDEALANGPVLSGSMLEQASSSDSDDEESVDLDRPQTPPLRLEDEIKTASWSARLPESGAPAPLAPSMLTLSLLPRTQVQMLAHLETVRARNAPREPPKKPESAPFFLPSLASDVNAGRNPVFAVEDASKTKRKAEHDDASGSRVKKISDPLASQDRSSLVGLLACQASAEAMLGLLRNLSPARVDLEIRGLTGLAAESDASMVLGFLQALLVLTRDGTDFDLVQGLLRLTLEVHGALFLESVELADVARELSAALRGSWERVDSTLASTRCVLGLLGNLQP